MTQTRVNIKGTSYGLIIHVGPGDWEGLLTELKSRLEQTPAFFKGGRVALHVGPRQLERHQLEYVGDLLKAHHVSLWAVISDSEETAQNARALGLETALSAPQVERSANEVTEDATAEQNAILVRRTLRSGQALHYTGHVIVVGDVNPGAEIVAGGDVVVWGRLRGTVHAGAGGDDRAMVCALGLSPTQLRISRHIARSPGGETDQEHLHTLMPEIASVQDGQIVVELWEAK